MVDKELKMINHCIKNNDPNFNLLKALEETAEFQEAVTKYHTKSDKNPNKPTRAHIVAEYADMMLRSMILIQQLFPEESENKTTERVEKALDAKLAKMMKWYEEGTYVNGL